VFVPKAIV
jgi:hypothetical protein